MAAATSQLQPGDFQSLALLANHRFCRDRIHHGTQRGFVVGIAAVLTIDTPLAIGAGTALDDCIEVVDFLAGAQALDVGVDQAQ